MRFKAVRVDSEGPIYQLHVALLLPFLMLPATGLCDTSALPGALRPSNSPGHQQGQGREEMAFTVLPARRWQFATTTFLFGKEKRRAVNTTLMKAQGWTPGRTGRRAAWGFLISSSPVHDVNSRRNNNASMLSQARICLKLGPTELCQIMCCSLRTAPGTLSSFCELTVPYL